MKALRHFLLASICVALGALFTGQASADNIDAKLPDSDNTSSFQVKDSADKVLMKVQSGGNVVIGTTAPEGTLDVKGAISGFGIVPIGSIIAWHKNLTGVPDLPDGWVECNGDTLNDSDSPLNGQTIPDLNGEERFLRGSSTSGVSQADAFQGHWHQIYFEIHSENGSSIRTDSFASGSSSSSTAVRQAITDGVNGTPRVASETRPINMSVVWIMRVK
jgi:hypothetical protein